MSQKKEAEAASSKPKKPSAVKVEAVEEREPRASVTVPFALAQLVSQDGAKLHKTGEDPKWPKLSVTIRGVGFRQKEYDVIGPASAVQAFAKENGLEG